MTQSRDPEDAGAPGGAALAPGVRDTGTREAQSGPEGLWVEGPAGTKAPGQDWAWLEASEGQMGWRPGRVGRQAGSPGFFC